MADPALSRAGAPTASGRTPLVQSKVFLCYSLGLENYQLLWNDSIFWLSIFNKILYMVAASIPKFMLGLRLALLLNEHIPFRAFIRAIVLLPWVVPTVLSAIAFWWIYDTQFSIISGRSEQRPRNGNPHERVARHSLRGDHLAGRSPNDLVLAP